MSNNAPKDENKRGDERYKDLQDRYDRLQTAYKNLKKKRVITHVEGNYQSRIEQLVDDDGKVLEDKRIEDFDDGKKAHIILVRSINHGFWWENYYYANEDGKRYGELYCGIVIKGSKKRYFTLVTKPLMDRKKSALMSVQNIKGYMGHDTMKGYKIEPKKSKK